MIYYIHWGNCPPNSVLLFYRLLYCIRPIMTVVFNNVIHCFCYISKGNFFRLMPKSMNKSFVVIERKFNSLIIQSILQKSSATKKGFERESSYKSQINQDKPNIVLKPLLRYSSKHSRDLGLMTSQRETE